MVVGEASTRTNMGICKRCGEQKYGDEAEAVVRGPEGLCYYCSAYTKGKEEGYKIGFRDGKDAGIEAERNFQRQQIPPNPY